MKVYNLRNTDGKAQANQFVIMALTTTVFQSYESTIAHIDGASKIITIGRDWNYSRTTARHFYEFMRQYAPLVDFPWCKATIDHLLMYGNFTDKFGRLWQILYDESMN